MRYRRRRSRRRSVRRSRRRRGGFGRLRIGYRM